MDNINIMLIGCGAHAKRIYLPALKKLNVNLKVVVEMYQNENYVKNLVCSFFENVEFCFIKKTNKGNALFLSTDLVNKLNEICDRLEINGVIISTDPLNHMQYAIWAERKKLHILMDKPISTRDNISNSVKQSRQLLKDYKLLLNNYSEDKAFIINAQRRFLPQFEIIQDKINEVSSKYGMPITSIQSMHSDGQWRLPNEILTFKYHPLLGYGKVSHSGYHFIDLASKLTKDSFKKAGKMFDEVSVYSKFIRASGILKNQNQEDLQKIFGDDYKKIDSRNNEELFELYKKNKEAEVDATALINLSSHNVPVTNITLNLIHNGYSLRSWLNPNMNDLYKGNGRVRHEYHNIIQGCLQNIQIHSYQAIDKITNDAKSNIEVGGCNHYDIYIFRNSGIMGGKRLEIITAEDIIEQNKLSNKEGLNELARFEAIKQFVEVIKGERIGSKTKSNIKDHYLTVQLMSMIYESGAAKLEVKRKI